MKQFTVCLGLLLFFLCMHSLASAQAGYVDFNPNISGTYVLPPASSEVAIHVTCYDDRVNGWYYHHLIIKKNGYDWWRKDDPYNYSDPDPSFGVGSWTLTGDEYEQFVFNGMISKYRTKTDTFTVVYPTPVAPTLASIGSTPGTYHPVLSWNDIGYYAVHQNTTNGYEIYRRDYEGINQLRVDWRKIASVSGTTTTWIDLSVGGAPMGLDRVDYKVQAVNVSNDVGPFSNVSSTQVFLRYKLFAGALPDEYSLQEAYPNPFNPTTHLRVDLPAAGHVVLRVLDIQGREVQALQTGFTEAGSYDLCWNAADQATGVYFGRLMVTDQLGKVVYSKTNKLLLTK